MIKTLTMMRTLMVMKTLIMMRTFIVMNTLILMMTFIVMKTLIILRTLIAMTSCNDVCLLLEIPPKAGIGVKAANNQKSSSELTSLMDAHLHCI